MADHKLAPIHVNIIFLARRKVIQCICCYRHESEHLHANYRTTFVATMRNMYETRTEYRGRSRAPMAAIIKSNLMTPSELSVTSITRLATGEYMEWGKIRRQRLVLSGGWKAQ